MRQYDEAMTADYYPLRMLLLAVSGWVHREQQRTIEYLVEENRVLKEQLKGRKLRLTDDQRRRLAAKGRLLDPPTVLSLRRGRGPGNPLLVVVHSHRDDGLV